MADDIHIREINGVGSYGVAPDASWSKLFGLIRNDALKLGFAPGRYALFDGLLSQLFPTLGAHDLTATLNGTLRDNIACVRNFLLTHYFENAPEGMTPDQARENLRLVARFLGEGLQWDEQLRAGKDYDPFKTDISIEEASAPNGEGARYLYHKVQEMDRHTSWVRPFAKVMELMGGKGQNEFHLPPLDETPFAHDDHSDDERLREQLESAAIDLDILGDQLIHGAAKVGSIQNISEPVRREAIDLAKDILNKLKIQFGDMNILAGLDFNPEDMTSMGSISGVMAMYDRLLAYARSIDPAILMHPAVMSATQAFGQVGYLCKQEAMRLATSAKNTKMAERIANQLKRTPNQFASLNDKRFGALTDRINKGIDTVLEKVQEISGPSALVGHSISQNISSFMTAAPTAGMANRQSLAQTSQRTLAAQRGEEAGMRAQADKMAQQAAQNSARGHNQQQQQTSRTASSRQARQQAQRMLRISQQMQRQRTFAAYRSHGHDHDEQHVEPTQSSGPPTAADIARQIDPRILMGFQNATNARNLRNPAASRQKNIHGQDHHDDHHPHFEGQLKPPETPLMPGTTHKGSMAQTPKPGEKTEAQKAVDSEKKKEIDQQMLAPPPPPNRGGRGM